MLTFITQDTRGQVLTDNELVTMVISHSDVLGQAQS